MKNRMRVACTLLAALFSMHATARDEINLEREPVARKHLNIYGFKVIKTLSFNDLGDNTAYTFLYRDEKDKSPIGYYVSIRHENNGAFLFITSGEPCRYGSRNSEDVIEVNSRAIQTISECAEDANKELVRGYKIKTEQGKMYVIDQFKRSKLVTIRFNSMNIPFENHDFEIVWNKVNKVAL